MLLFIALVLMSIVAALVLGLIIFHFTNMELAFLKVPHLRYYVKMLRKKPNNADQHNSSDLSLHYKIAGNQQVVFKINKDYNDNVSTVVGHIVNSNERPTKVFSTDDLPKYLKARVKEIVQRHYKSIADYKKEATKTKMMAMTTAIKEGKHVRLMDFANAKKHTEDTTQYSDETNTLVVFTDKSYGLYCLKEK